jgi:hypothetical protein
MLPQPNIISTGHRPLGLDGQHDRDLDVHRDRRMAELSTCPITPPSHDRLAADRGLHGLGHRPRDLRHVCGHPAVDLALEVLGDLRTPPLPPRLGGRDLASVLQVRASGQSG